MNFLQRTILPAFFGKAPLLLAALLMTGLLSDCRTSQPVVNGSTEPVQDNESTVLSEEALYNMFNDLRNQPKETPIWAAKRGLYNPERTRYFILHNTRLEVAFDWAKQHLLGKATLTVAPYFYAQDSVVLDAKTFDIHRVALVNLKDTLSLQWRYDSLQLTVLLNRTYQKGEKLNLYIDYTARPNDRAAGGSEAITSDKGLYFINPLGKEKFKPRQIWTQGETEASSCWFPTFDAPNAKSAQEIYITVDSTFVTVSNGKLVSQKFNRDGTRTDYWKQEKAHAPYLFAMAIGQYAVVKDKWKNMEVSYYVEPEFGPYARDIFGHTPEMLEFFSNLLDYPYPWDKYAQVVVRDFVSGAMENTGVSIFMEDLQVDRRSLVDQHWDGIIAHELFHHWFGNLVTCESWANLPLNESFANYSEYLWTAHKYGLHEADLLLEEELGEYMEEAKTKQEPLIRYYYTDKEDMFDQHSYSKGAVILHHFRNVIGDEAFFEGMRRYLKKFAYGKAEIHDLRLVYEEVTGQDLNWFFNQWFLSAGHPDLIVKTEYEDGAALLKVNQQQDSAYTPIYRLPLSVDIWVGGKKERHKIVVDQPNQEFRFPVAQQPDLVLFDAETHLPGVNYQIKTTEEFIYQFYHAEKILSRMEALRELQSGLEEEPRIAKVFLDALSADFWSLREIAASGLEGYQGPYQEAVSDKLRQLALTDPKSYVRASAFSSLASLGEVSDIIDQILSDSSYLVQAYGLYISSGQRESDDTSLLSLYESLEQVRNANIVISVADYYSYQAIPGKLKWFEEQAYRASGQLSEILIRYIGMYLLNQPEPVQQRGIETLADFARNAGRTNSRASAYMALSLLSEVNGVPELMRSIRESEKDEQLKGLYESLGNQWR